jgi:hypothetical protein
MENSLAITILYATICALTTEILVYYFPKAKGIAEWKDAIMLFGFALLEPFSIRATEQPLNFALHAMVGILLYEIIRLLCQRVHYVESL